MVSIRVPSGESRHRRRHHELKFKLDVSFVFMTFDRSKGPSWDVDYDLGVGLSLLESYTPKCEF